MCFVGQASVSNIVVQRVCDIMSPDHQWAKMPEKLDSRCNNVIHVIIIVFLLCVRTWKKNDDV